MDILLVVSDWIVMAEDGSYIKEEKSSVTKMSSIVAPRKEYNNYEVGEVRARFYGREYETEIIAIGRTGKCLKVIIFASLVISKHNFYGVGPNLS